jgi:hypothetical protein
MAKHVEKTLTDGTLLVTWKLSDKDADGEVKVLPSYRVASVQVGLVAGVVECSGSLVEDGDVWATLHDRFGAPAMLGSCELKTLAENVHRFKPQFRGEGDVMVYLLIRRV